ncbi:hypothetical protein QQP08_009609 [Theobroma cacao]|nr:hypothetical protein QQP08_009609 [Theobroma cacao]
MVLKFHINAGRIRNSAQFLTLWKIVGRCLNGYSCLFTFYNYKFADGGAHLAGLILWIKQINKYVPEALFSWIKVSFISIAMQEFLYVEHKDSSMMAGNLTDIMKIGTCLMLEAENAQW